MKTLRTPSAQLAVLLLGFLCMGSGPQAPPSNAAADLGGTSWRLVKFEGSDDKTLTADDPTRYTIQFESKGTASVRIDCNRGHGTWSSSGPHSLEFGPLALTRAMCPPAPLNDRIVKDWAYVRSYMLRDGHLFLSLMADGGIYKFEPLGEETKAGGSVKGTARYRERMALPPDAVFEATLEDISKADAPAESLAGCASTGLAILQFISKSDTTPLESIRVTVTRCGAESWSAASCFSRPISSTRY